MEELKNIAANETEQRTVDGVPVQINYVCAGSAPVSDAEIRAYISRGNEQHHGSSVSGLNLQVEGEDVGISYDLTPLPFERIRRITGYLVGTLDRFNDGKRAEEADRVKHSVGCGC
ncbi:anaerobic ribonucleoside-triphosphate reductase [Adlercreutzia aquisgranensis]|uniref:Uncharacterized protein n=1 Tax=Muribaculaceae bacterium Z82 TaxID=2304548 RepID=A0A7C9NL09_9BACT|nr:anaerobic ribonucleoside-triphosphate reductase [Adlercreutzia aquisgranensis]